jgi:indole-3-glycerol phosphate synthase
MPREVPSVLQEIVAYKREEVAARRTARPHFELAGLPPVRGFAAAISRQLGDEQGHRPEVRRPVRLIAEVKHASPVKGVLRPDFDPLALARSYYENGAAAISVLTDERFFMGHPDYLRQIREIVPIPLLRKEFIIDEWQLPESRALGADAVLLIVAILSPVQLRDYLQRTEALGMEALVEVHTEAELEVALAAGARIIGVNNRDLNTFVTDLATTERFAARIKHEDTARNRVLVSESGIRSAADVASVEACGTDAVLVGEALVRGRDVAAKVRELAGSGEADES